MKKKLVSLLSLILVAVMVFPVGVFADETGEGEETTPTPPDFKITSGAEETDTTKATIYTNSKKNTIDLDVDEYYTNVFWSSNATNIATVDMTSGLVTAVAPGKATITVTNGDTQKKDTVALTVEARTLQSHSITKEDTVDKEYVSGQAFNPAGLEVTAVFNDGEVKLTSFELKDKNSLLTAGKTSEIVIGYSDNYPVEVEVGGLSVVELAVESINVVSAKNTYTEGDTLSDIEVEVTYNDGTIAIIRSGFELDFSGALTLDDDDMTVTVTYRGKSDTFKVNVEAEETETQAPAPSTPTGPSYTLKILTAPTKTPYKVGEKFDATGMIFQVVRDRIDRTGSAKLMYHDYTFTAADKGANKSITLSVIISYGEETVTKQITVSDLTVTDAVTVDETRLRDITSVTLKDDVNFIEGTEITLADIEKIKVKFIDNTTDTIYSNEFANYEFTSDLDLEVYTSEGARKTSSTYRDTIRPDDIYEDDDGDKVVNLALRYKYYKSTSSSTSYNGEYKIVAPITEADVAYYFKTKYITEYEDLEDALLYCNTQDDDIDEDVFDISDVDEDDYLQLKLGKSFTLSSSYEFTPDNNIVIDLNGRNLTLYSDTFEFDEYEDFTITVKNTAANEAKLTYKDKDITIVLKKGDSVSFNEDNTTPGIYTVTVKFDSAKGTVTASPAISSGKITAGKGTEIKFTITPKTGYDVDTVKADAKSVVTDKDNYSVNTNTGVATYTLESLTKDITFEATFKAQKKAWQNPFSDVKSTANYYSAVEFVYENELFKGTTNTTFSPNTTMTRAMFVTVLGRLAGIDEATAARKYGNDSDFTDVSASNGRISYAVPYIKWAVENGIVEGYGDGTFGPENEITHQQMYVMMYRYARFVENKGGSFSSVSLSMSDRSSVADWATDAVKYAQYNDYLVYTNNTKTLIDPTGDAKRSELAMLLEQFCATVLGWAAE